MSIASKIKGVLSWYIKETNRKEIHPIVNSVSIPKLLDGKVAMVMGGQGGIGKAIVESFVNSGCKVIVVSRRANGFDEKDPLHGNENIAFLQFDLSNLKEFDSVLSHSVGLWGKIDILVNTAGTHTVNVDFWTVSEKEYDRVLDINLKGCYFVSRAVGKYMKENNIKGHILNVSSSTGGEPSWSPYRISKRGLEGITKGMAMIMQPFGIVVNGIAPGEVATNLIDWHEGDSIYTDHNHFGRMVMPQEVANLALFLVSDMGNMVVGDMIYMSGGRGVFDIR